MRLALALHMSPGEVEERLTGEEAWALLRQLDSQYTVEEIIDCHLSSIHSSLRSLGGQGASPQDFSLLHPKLQLTEEEEAIAWIGRFDKINEH